MAHAAFDGDPTSVATLVPGAVVQVVADAPAIAAASNPTTSIAVANPATAPTRRLDVAAIATPRKKPDLQDN